MQIWNFENTTQFYEVIEKIKALTEEVKVYGMYKNGKAPSP